MSKKEPQPDTLARYLQGASLRSLQSFELARLGEAAGIRRELIEMVDRLVDAITEAKTARALYELHRKPSADAHAAEETLGEIVRKLLPGKVIPKRLKGK